MLKSIPLIVVTNDQLGLLGTRQYALKLLDPENSEVDLKQHITVIMPHSKGVHTDLQF